MSTTSSGLNAIATAICADFAKVRSKIKLKHWLQNEQLARCRVVPILILQSSDLSMLQTLGWLSSDRDLLRLSRAVTCVATVYT